MSASENKVDLIIFPECALTGYPPRDIAGSARINVNVVSEAIQELQKLADELDIHIIVGTINYVDSKYYNRAYLVSPNKAKRWYDKRALYGWDEDKHHCWRRYETNVQECIYDCKKERPDPPVALRKQFE